MIIYHTAYDLQMFYGWNLDVFSGGWKIMQVATASLFLLLVGVTSSFSTRHPLKRFITIGSAALLVSVVTYAIDSETYVRFGILHLIAVSGLIMPLLRRFGIWLLIPAGAILMLSPLVSAMHPHTSALLPFGFSYPGFNTIDYFPLIPWLGVILIGHILGLYWVRWMHVMDHSPFSWLGKHSLALYLIHQPIIIGILWMLLGRPAF